MSKTNRVYEFPKKNKEGFTSAELIELLKEFPDIDMKKYNNAMLCHTCPMIDGIIKSINNAIAALADENIDSDQYKEFVEEAIGELHGLETVLEDIRSANLSLRNWGSDEAKKVDELEKENESLTKQLNNRELEINDLEKSISNLENEIEKLKSN